jgi:hypothetical protein
VEVKLQAVIMLPPGGRSEAERWVASGKRACARDLAKRLLEIEAVDHLTALVVDPEDDEALESLGVEVHRSDGESFQFGEALAEIIERKSIQQLAYFGGASAPLLERGMLEPLIARVKAETGPYAIANNLHSTDWIIINQADLLASHSHRLPSDNPLGWVLSHEAGVRVDSAQQSAATRLDIDTPTDLLMVWGHPSLGPELGAFLTDLSPELKDKLKSVRRVINTPASTLAIIGRASAHVWKTLVEKTEIWVRLFVEERGMVASHRLANGEVQSLIAQMVDLLGPEKIVDLLSKMADGVLWDTRVWMGTRSEWPSDADRFAADLGWTHLIENQDLRSLTEAIEESSVPILAGGYGVVGGGLYALLESLDLEIK